ncbi:hypothetical protein Pint_28123 [Pistacia integerrima]|uniref:Uncharacterized protein n=1 Tax=Pistacia integerrima TaxID=434235 RepID=A0ACC0YRW4_9ROSI|nr:hypothetical protein Pint_28123 [Pistacia integerrima]
MDASATEQSSSPTAPAISSDVWRDIFLWRRKNLSLSVLLTSTVIWVLLEVYHFNFVTVVSWVAMAITTLLFLWGNIRKLLGKAPPNMSGLEISEQSALEVANACRGIVEEVEKWMFHVSVDRGWFVFVQVVAGLLLLSYVGTVFSLLTLLYIGVMMGMTVPLSYKKYEDKIKSGGECLKVKSRRFYDMIDDKVIKNMKNKIVKEKEKKIQ